MNQNLPEQRCERVYDEFWACYKGDEPFQVVYRCERPRNHKGKCGEAIWPDDYKLPG